jgi:nicotinate-nucleotide pyrophosphorylase (carboxylating)
MLPTPLLDDWLWLAIREDIGTGDVTTEALVPPDSQGRAEILSKEPFAVAGVDLALRTFTLLSGSVRVLRRVEDGAMVEEGTVLLALEGHLRALLTGERVALNLLQHLSGVATMTRRFVDAVQGTGVKILDTRKTLPGLRILDKYAVRVGGGRNHRASLSEGILIKENHILACGGIHKALGAIRKETPHTLRVEIEATTLEEVREALDAGVDAILLDNMPVEAIRQAVECVRGAVELEVSGGVTLENVRGIAETGIDAISVGRITHSAPSVDVSMLLRDA